MARVAQLVLAKEDEHIQVALTCTLGSCEENILRPVAHLFHRIEKGVVGASLKQGATPVAPVIEAAVLVMGYIAFAFLLASFVA